MTLPLEILQLTPSNGLSSLQKFEHPKKTSDRSPFSPVTQVSLD